MIGISGRYPQAANLDEYWRNLKEGRDSIIEIPADRWSLQDFYVDSVQEALKQGRSYSKWGGFIDGFADFDPLFFNISPVRRSTWTPRNGCFCSPVGRHWKTLGSPRRIWPNNTKAMSGSSLGSPKRDTASTDWRCVSKAI
ncbi:beta-ketoacyl synthase N-terminal-like domain-containing protein [Azorhizophilus paspali]|uniref:beta-ketoacyl synthase N-terminal-like domain-containing protein n=1 Tax=Azorhizophilus paspali TaxID=69963 RepID=UPI003633E500